MEIRQNNLSGSDFEKIKNLYPKLYKLKVGENAIKSLDVFKCFVSILFINFWMFYNEDLFVKYFISKK